MRHHILVINNFFILPNYPLVRNAGAVIHTHSKSAVLISLLFEGNEFQVSHLEMVKVSE